MLIFNDTEEKAAEKAIVALADMIPLEAIQPPHSPTLVFPGLEIRLHQRRVLKDGADIYLTRLEYGALCYLAASPGRVFTKAQIFESVWSMGSESCQSSVASVICNLRKKIEPDSKNPTYIKTVLGSQKTGNQKKVSCFLVCAPWARSNGCKLCVLQAVIGLPVKVWSR